jgi:DNA-binding MarR family transcriptional regulator
VVHGVEKLSKRMASEIGVTGPQRLVLRVVGLFPGVSAGELASILHLHPSTLTGVLQRLTTQRLLVRVSHPADRRRAVLRLTRAGVRANGISRGTVELAVSKTLRGMPVANRRVLRKALQALATHFEVASAQPWRTG